MNEVERGCEKEKWSGGGATLHSKSGSYPLRFNLSRKLKNKKGPGHKEQRRACQVKKKKNTMYEGPEAWPALTEWEK